MSRRYDDDADAEYDASVRAAAIRVARRLRDELPVEASFDTRAAYDDLIEQWENDDENP